VFAWDSSNGGGREEMWLETVVLRSKEALFLDEFPGDGAGPDFGVDMLGVADPGNGARCAVSGFMAGRSPSIIRTARCGLTCRTELHATEEYCIGSLITVPIRRAGTTGSITQLIGFFY
jgi:hypothetical protein